MHDNELDELTLLPDDDDLVAYLGWFLFVSGAFLVAVFAAVLITGWLLLT